MLFLKDLNLKVLKNKYFILLIIASMGVLLFLFGYFANQKIETEIKSSISELFTYEGLDVDVFSRSIQIEAPKMVEDNLVFSAASISIDGINYYQYLFEDKIAIENVFLKSPELLIIGSKNKSAQREDEKNFKADISIGTIKTTDGKINIKKNDTTSSFFFAFNDFTLKEVSMDSASVQQKIPFNYESFSLNGDSLRLKLGKLHSLVSSSIAAENGKVILKKTQITPKYGKVEFQQHIPFEKDRFELHVEKIILNDLSFKFKNDSLYLKNPVMTIEGANFEAYRNKLLPDDPRIKDLYSEKIRELPVKIDFGEVQVKNSSIIYLEKSKKDRPPLKVDFQDLNATITNLTNVEHDGENIPKTEIIANTLFMGVALVEFNWEFSVGNPSDGFHISGNMGSIRGEALNPALKPAMNILAEGKVVSLAFNYSGNNNRARGDMRVQYDDFKIIVLQKDGRKKNKFLSAIANLFVKNDAITKDIVHKDLEVERVKTKSFWNYFWLMIREGALKAFL